MRIPRDNRLTGPDQLAPDEVRTSIAGRKKELGALIQAGLKVGADLAAREAGRRAYAEFAKLDDSLQPPTGDALGASGQMVFEAPKRRRLPAGV